MHNEISVVEQELREIMPSDLRPVLDKRDGPSILLTELPKTFSPKVVSFASREQRCWELIGLYYRDQGRYFEALSIFSALYDHMLLAQNKTGKRAHKGMPLVWMRDIYAVMGFPALAKRYLMLTLCEDAVAMKGDISPTTSGVYFRLVWVHGLADTELKRYAREIYNLSNKFPSECMFPEWVLQEIDQDWITEFPSLQEIGVYKANKLYIRYLMSQLGEPTGKALERLADYLLACMPGCRTTRRQRSGSTDYDIVCSMEGLEVDFRSELGRYFVVECKDWKNPVDYTTLAKFCRVLDSTKSRFGILFSKKGITGRGKMTDAEREQLKVFQDRGMVIVALDLKDVDKVANGINFINMLKGKYEKVRLDLLK